MRMPGRFAVGISVAAVVAASCSHRAPSRRDAGAGRPGPKAPGAGLREAVPGEDAAKPEAPPRREDVLREDARHVDAPAEEGPASWEHVGWGGGGFFWSCVFHPTDPDVIYLGGDVGGMYKSEDAGRHWRFVNSGLSSYAVHSLAISESSPDTLYAMTGGGVCRTTNGARSWEFLERTGRDGLDISLDRPRTVRALAVDPRDAEVVYAGSRRGRLYKSVDGGLTWRKLDYVSPVAGLSRGGKKEPIAFTGRGSLVLRFESEGASWSRNGRAEKIFAWPADFSAAARMTARFLLPRAAPKMQAQLVVQAGEKWLWQDGPFVEGKPGEWTEVALDLRGKQFLGSVRAVYFVIRSPHAGYRGSIHLDAVTLHHAHGGTTSLLADWEEPGDVAGWRHCAGRQNYDLVTGVSQSERAAAPVESGVISSVALSRADPKLVLATSTAYGVLRSADAGETWSSRPEVPANASSVAVSPGDPNVVYASFWKEGVFKSTDAGRTWARASEGIGKDCSVREVAVHPKDPATVFAIGCVGWDGRFCKSTDGGASWSCGRKPLATDVTANPTVPQDAHSAGTSRLSNIAVSPADPARIFIAANWRNCFSGDGGETWEERSRGADITCVEDIRFRNGKTYAVAMDEGLLVSDDDGKLWRQLCPLRYSDEVSGHQWRVRVRGEPGAERIVSTLSPWNAKHANRVLVSDDGGATFAQVTSGLPDYVPGVNCMWGRGYPRALAQDPVDPDVLYLGIDGDPEPAKGLAGGGVFKSADGGRTWKRLPGQPASRRMFFGLAVDPTDRNRIYWGACGENGGLHRTTDGGSSWERVFDGETWVFNVAVSPSGAVYCPGQNLWRSDDHGETWAKLTDFADGFVIVGLEIDPRNERRMWFSRVTWGETAAGGIYRTEDGGATWEEITGDIPYKKPLVLRYNAETGHLWAGGVGLFRIRQ